MKRADLCANTKSTLDHQPSFERLRSWLVIVAHHRAKKHQREKKHQRGKKHQGGGMKKLTTRCGQAGTPALPSATHLLIATHLLNLTASMPLLNDARDCS